jgi:hypothetical protein
MRMDAVARGAGVGHFCVLQPNQYFTSRVFDDQERSIAIDQALI